MARLLDRPGNHPFGKVLSIAFLVLAVLAVIYAVRSVRSEAINRTHYRLFMDSENGKTFSLEIKKGMSIPVVSPYSGKATGYQPEACFWNADGTTKTTPTYVILNADLGKPGPTFCPDCGRLVVSNNPPPMPGMRPPPTREEYYAQRYHDPGNQ